MGSSPEYDGGFARCAGDAGQRPALRAVRVAPVLLREVEGGGLSAQLEHEDVRVHEHAFRIEGRRDLEGG